MGWLAGLGSESRSVQDWLNDDDDEGARTSAGVKVTRGTALTVPTFLRGMDLLASIVAGSPRDVVIKVGSRTFPEYRNVPRWVDQPDPTDPTLTGWRYIYSLISSLVVAGNYFVHAYPNVLDPQVLTALDPGRVRTPDASSDFEILDDKGKVVAVLSPNEVLHGVMYPWAGERRGPAPLDLMARTIGSAIAADDFAARFFGQGAALSFGVEVPTQLTEEQKKTLRENLKARHQGNRNSHAIGVLTAGAKFVGGLAPTPEQAQMLETRKFSVEEFARFLGVPPFMLGSQEPGAASYASTSIAKDAFSEFTALPLVQRVEDQHNRLLADFTPVPNGRAQFKLNMDHLLRADLEARYRAYETGIRSGVLKPDEARDKENLGPVPGGDRVYMQAQMTPLAQLGTKPEAPEPVRSEPDTEPEVRVSVVMPQPEAIAEAADARMGELLAGLDRLSEAVLAQPAPVVNVAAPVVNVPPFPEIPPTVVNVPPFPAIPAPVVKVDTAPLARVVEGLREVPTRKRVKRDAAGRITEVVEEPMG